MDREPFAYVEDDSEPGNPCFDVWIGEECVTSFKAKKTADFLAGIINGFYYARVKEVEKAAISWAQHQCGCAKCVNPGF